MRCYLTMQRLLAITVVLAARIATAAPPKLPAHYAAMFDLHHAWTYDVSLTTWDYDKMDQAKATGRRMPKTTEHVVIKCSVERVETVGTILVSQVTCDRDYDRAFLVPGFYVADAAGLHRLSIDAFPAAESDILPLNDPDIAAKPRPMHKVTKDDFFNARTTDDIRKEGVAWCVYNDTTELADGGPASICYANGVASGNDNTGGELHHITWHAR